MRYLPAFAVFVFACASATPVFAHLGHVGELAGHSHWIAIGASGIAAAIGVAVALAGKKASKAAQDDDTAEGQENAGEDIEAEADR
jgi:Family of unknown function (DUF6732)